MRIKKAGTFGAQYFACACFCYAHRRCNGSKRCYEMNALRLPPVFVSALLVAAHFLRLESFILAGVSLAAPLLLFILKPRSAQVVQFCLILASLEWCRTLYALAQQRIANGEPWLRLAVILGLVALLKGISACVFSLQPLKLRYKLGKNLKI